MEKEILQKAGLTANEASLYLELLELGQAQAGLLSRKTGIHRRSIYDALERLIEKGLVSYIMENGKRYYIATDPKSVQELIDEKRQEIYDVLPTLHAKFLEHKDKQETVFYRGKEGIKTVYEDQLATTKDIYIIGASADEEKVFPYYLPHYTKRRIAKKIKVHALFSGT